VGSVADPHPATPNPEQIAVTIRYPEGARAKLDGGLVTGNPFIASVARDANMHHVSIEEDGYKTEERTVTFDKPVDLSIDLTPYRAPSQPLKTPAHPRREGRSCNSSEGDGRSDSRRRWPASPAAQAEVRDRRTGSLQEEMTSQRPPRFVSVAFLLVALAASTTAAPAFAAPDSSTEASEHFQRGVEFSKDGDFEAALVEFKRAYELSPNYRVLYNLGQTSRELRDYAGALRSFTQYLKEGGNEAPKHEKVEAWIAELKGKVAYISVKSNVAGAEIAVDDVSVGPSPLKDPVIVNAGKRKVSATLSGYTPTQKYVDLAGTDSKTVTLELVQVGAQNPGGDKGRPGGDNGPIVPARKASPAPWIALAGTGAFAIATGVIVVWPSPRRANSTRR